MSDAIEVFGKTRVACDFASRKVLEGKSTRPVTEVPAPRQSSSIISRCDAFANSCCCFDSHFATMYGAEAGRSQERLMLSIDIEDIWPSYFPESDFSAEDRRVKLIAELCHLFSTPPAEPLLSLVKNDGGLFYLPVDFQHIQKICEVEKFYTALQTEPKEALLCMGAAVHKALSLKWKDDQPEDGMKINIRLHNHPDSTIALKNLKASYIENHEEGRVPRTVECELTEDLVDACIPGDVITVTGIIKVINNYMDIGGGKQGAKLNGDPGLGKSQLLQAAANVSPRGIYVCGNASTNAGLTVAVVKDPMTNDYAFEAGAMVLADRGLCCIDEFDKMSAEHQALFEAMEQQCVSVAKAGLVASLSARTSVLAAANPVGGHYNRAKTVNENLKMNAALLSRFDLVFILLDRPDELIDKRVSEHIMADMGSIFHLQKSSVEVLSVYELITGSTNNFCFKQIALTFQSGCAVLQNDMDMEFGAKSGSLASRLRLDPKKDKDFIPLPAPLLHKYIAYARSFVFPRCYIPNVIMSRSAAEILQKFYLQLRDHSTSADGTPITARQLESLVRLAEARARLELREETTAQDALKGSFGATLFPGRRIERGRDVKSLPRLRWKNPLAPPSSPSADWQHADRCALIE
ncbi:DNA replication licensing factor mcm8 [Asimina triloba]